MSDMEATPPEEAAIPWYRAKQFMRQAWDEGHEAGVGHGKEIADWQNLEGYGDYDVHPKPQPNPYREES